MGGSDDTPEDDDVGVGEGEVSDDTVAVEADDVVAELVLIALDEGDTLLAGDCVVSAVGAAEPLETLLVVDSAEAVLVELEAMLALLSEELAAEAEDIEEGVCFCDAAALLLKKADAVGDALAGAEAEAADEDVAVAELPALPVLRALLRAEDVDTKEDVDSAVPFELALVLALAVDDVDAGAERVLVGLTRGLYDERGDEVARADCDELRVARGDAEALAEGVGSAEDKLEAVLLVEN